MTPRKGNRPRRLPQDCERRPRSLACLDHLDNGGVAEHCQEEEQSGEGRRSPARPVRSAARDETVTLALLNGLDVSYYPAIRDWTQGYGTTVTIPWTLANLEGTSPEWCRKAAQALAYLLARHERLYDEDWECLLDLPDTSTHEGREVAIMHNATMAQARRGL